MERDFSIETREKALEAIKILNSIINLVEDWTSEKMRTLRRGVGMSIGKIDDEIFSFTNKIYPELGHLR